MVDLEKVKIKESGFVHMGGWVWGGGLSQVYALIHSAYMLPST